MEGRGVRIERIADHKLREAVFRRRKNGLLRRAMELSVMADCDVAVLVFHGSSGALTQYSSSPIGGMLQRFARACGKPHETYTNEDLYSHHVLAQLAADADEAAGASAKRTRTLPSFWAAKAALERQQRQPNGWHAGGGGGGGQGEGVGAAPREGKRRRTEEGQQAGGEEGRKAASPSPSDFSDLDRQAAALAELAEGEACPLTPRSSLAYQRIAREFDRLVARAREEMETAEALAAVAEEDGEEEQEGAADEEGGAAEEAVAAGGGSTPAGHIAAGTPAAGEAAAATPTTEEGEGPAADVAGDGDVEMTEAAGAAAAVHAPAVEPPASPPPPLAESPGSREVEHPTPSLSALPLSAGQPDQQNTPSTPAPAGVPAAADAALAPSRPSTNGALPSLSAAAGPGSGHQQPQLQQLQQLHQFQQQQQQQEQQTLQLPAGVVRGTAVGPSPRATLPAGSPHLVLPPGMQLPKGALAQLPAAARMQLGALPRGGGYVLRPVAVPMVGGAAGGGGGAGQQQQGMMLQLQPVAMQPGQLQQYQRLLLQQQQQLAAMHAAATKAAHLNAAAAVAQQQQQQPAQASQPGQPQEQSAGDEVVLPIVSQPHVQLPQEQQRPQPGHDAVADMLA